MGFHNIELHLRQINYFCPTTEMKNVKHADTFSLHLFNQVFCSHLNECSGDISGVDREHKRLSYLNEEDEVFEGGVEVGLLLQLDDWIKVLVVDVSVDTEQTLQDGLCHRHEVLWERDTWDTVKRGNRFRSVYKLKLDMA